MPHAQLLAFTHIPTGELRPDPGNPRRMQPLVARWEDNLVIATQLGYRSVWDPRSWLFPDHAGAAESGGAAREGRGR
ncbi:MAG TPA: hypothetical protein VFA32_13400 [Dehalococcoidia bacterium]|jgi:hypothetical protein|nr:hypothetical protein [Dehalococcoidia bacterium]